MKKAILTIIGLMLVVVLSGCNAQNPDKIGATTIYVDKEGKIIETVVEDFSMSHYSDEELKQFIEQDISLYHENKGEEVVGLEFFEVKDEIVKVQMSFATAEDYREFNSVDIFNGTISEALSSGYSLDVILKALPEEEETIGIHEILTMQDKKVLITDVPARLRCELPILYVSEDTVVIDEYEVDAFENTDATIIIY